MRKPLLVAGLLVLLTACAGPEPAAPAPTPRPHPHSVAIGPRERTYLAALGSIHPSFVTNQARAVVNGHDLCAAVAQGKDHAAVLATATWDFTGAAVAVDPAMAEQIVATAEMLC
ncbi:lipoprotein [Amycolatopsis rhabdoformis]|uniref:Lipoprotein n=1 Tax=Amycolatopsis rhabdoformis TaxID=1448059 RepID=A0ABZ1IIY4_9PSEU|nr:lipoprotein [Amycolatopsis rhabdoformis]WSE34410.1 lipoprotein [Amycolatopsis rhabdoformis]